MPDEATVIGIVPFNAWTQSWELISANFDPEKHVLVEHDGTEVSGTYESLGEVPAAEDDDEALWYLVVEKPREFG